MRESSFRDAEGAEIHYRAWEPAGPARAVLLVSHGMAEHSGRYARLGEAAAARGFSCWAPDHRGHGLTGKAAGSLHGNFRSPEGFSVLADDLAELAGVALAAAGAKPLFLFGHSMGSFAALDFAERRGAGLAGLILMGSSGRQGLLSKAGIPISRLLALFRGRERPSPFLTGMNFGPYALSVEDPRTPYDWLSRDEAEVGAYVADPLCGFALSAGFYADFLPAFYRILRPSSIARIPSSVPTLVLAGSEDPVGGKGRYLDDLLASLSLRDEAWAELGVYEGARHELLNETCRDEVTADLLGWIEGRLGGAGRPGA